MVFLKTPGGDLNCKLIRLDFEVTWWLRSSRNTVSVTRKRPKFCSFSCVSLFQVQGYLSKHVLVFDIDINLNWFREISKPKKTTILVGNRTCSIGSCYKLS